MEGGLQRKWIGGCLHRAALDGNFNPVAHIQTSEPAPIAISHLQTAF
jgi:hypothetical protein